MGVAVPYAVDIGYESVVVAMGQKVGDILICDRKDSPRMGGDHFARVLLQQVVPGHPKIAYWLSGVIVVSGPPKYSFPARKPTYPRHPSNLPPAWNILRFLYTISPVLQYRVA